MRTQESEYEQLLLLSHDAHMSKQAAKQELSKFEAIIAEERRSREGELQQRRKVLQSKQQKVDELDKSEKARACALPSPKIACCVTFLKFGSGLDYPGRG